MINSRNTYVNINLKNIRDNVEYIINKYNDYKYYFGVVKADGYNHDSVKVSKMVIDSGCNYLAVSSVIEAAKIRKGLSKYNEIKYNNIPILCLESSKINKSYITNCLKYNITITIVSLEQLIGVINIKDKFKIDISNLKIHIKLDTGMNRLGLKDKQEFNKVYKLINDNNLYLEGIYTHIFKSSNETSYINQIEVFKKLTSDIDLNKIKIVHIPQSESLIRHAKLPFVNGARLGIIMYGFLDKNLKSTFSLYSEIIQINKLKKGDSVSYDGNYIAKEDEIIATVAIGYADGVIRKYTGAYVYINDKKYKIIGNVCMDMIMIKIDDTIKLYDKVIILKDNKHILEIAKHLDTISYEVICNIGKRVMKKYIVK